ncbi:hypothetical protein ACVWYH_005418 [Bradyrhizobium sp. GM24.11]
MMEAATEAIQAPEGGSGMSDQLTHLWRECWHTVYAYSYLFQREQAIAGSPRPHHGYVR